VGTLGRGTVRYSSLASAPPTSRSRAVLNRMATELPLVSENNSPGGEAITSFFTNSFR